MNYEQTILDSLQHLGYTLRESQFLYLAAFHSGVFTADQFAVFNGLSRGKTDQQFCEKLLSQGHAQRYPLPLRLRGPAHYYHLCSKTIYRAIGQINSSSRKRPQTARLLQKVLGLSFILQHPDLFYFKSEHERVDYFTQERKVPFELLPKKEFIGRYSKTRTARYFVDKFPLAVDSSGTLVFTYIDDETQDTAVLNHINLYAPFWRALAIPMRLYFVSRTARNLERAHSAFEAQVLNRYGPASRIIPELVEYFRLEQKRETEDRSHWTHNDMVRRSDLGQKYRETDLCNLYMEWRTAGVVDPAKLGSVFTPAAREFIPLEVKRCAS